MTEARQIEILNLADSEYINTIMNGNDFVNKYEAARNFAINCIVAEVWKDHGITAPVQTIGRDDVRAEVDELIRLFDRGLD